jgi:4-oxalocrotonate tautomerase
MPTLHLRITPLHNPQHYAALGQTLTELTARVLRKRADVTVVLIDDLPAARYLIGGQSATGTAACLQVSITAGTNTVEEKSQFVSQAYALLTQLLGPLHSASYIIVHELPASDWGYGGMTQLERRMQVAAVA